MIVKQSRMGATNFSGAQQRMPCSVSDIGPGFSPDIGEPTTQGGVSPGINWRSSLEEVPAIAQPTPMSPAEQAEEQRLLRRLQMMMNLVMQTIAQDRSLSIDEASQMIADSRKAALAMFPGKELAYDLIWRPRFQRLMRERFRIM
jgi:hypothetical protein